MRILTEFCLFAAQGARKYLLHSQVQIKRVRIPDADVQGHLGADAPGTVLAPPPGDIAGSTNIRLRLTVPCACRLAVASWICPWIGG